MPANESYELSYKIFCVNAKTELLKNKIEKGQIPERKDGAL
jgi:hypothetical protein